MKRLLRNLIGIILPLLLIGEITAAATVMNVSINASRSFVDDNGQWEAVSYYIEEIEVLRSHRGESFNISIPENKLLSGEYLYGHVRGFQGLKQSIRVDYNGIDLSYGGSLQAKGYSNYNVKTNNTSDEILLELKPKNNYSGAPTIHGTRIISVDGSVPDGRYIITTTLTVPGTSGIDTQLGVIIIKTLPTISIEDIDFGDHPVDERINIVKTTNISISGGTPRERFTLSIEGSEGSEGRNIGERRYVLQLKNPNTDDEIPVKLSIRGIPWNPRLDYSGNANARLKARIKSKLPSTGGEYTGRAKIIFQYD